MRGTRTEAPNVTDVAVDLGKTSCRARVCGRPTEEARGGGSPGLAAFDGTTSAVAAVVESLHSLPTEYPWGTLAVGAAGALAAPEAAATCAELLLRETGARRVVITSDAVTAHVGAFAGAPGLAVIAGTGAVTIGVDASGAVAIGDGSGPESGDRGSGAWIGRVALERAAAGAEPLAGRARQRYGPGWQDLLAEGRGYELARRRGKFVADVASLASAGDPTASAVIRDAAEELARTARETARRLEWPTDDVRVALLGGLTGLGGRLTEPFAASIRPARLVPAKGTALDGAALLIDRHDLPHEAWVLRKERP
jgi:glucosamine kinase